ncbi:hypothetical protein GQ600_11137 [Phytophthora cactorum]|nr:hypothetical protein GQ600_11137 [Phytophthora cactorum]
MESRPALMGRGQATIVCLQLPSCTHIHLSDLHLRICIAHWHPSGDVRRDFTSYPADREKLGQSTTHRQRSQT